MAAAMSLFPAASLAQTRVLGPYITAMDRETPLVVVHTEVETEIQATLQGEPDGPVLQEVSNGKHHNFAIPAGPGIESVLYTLLIDGEEISHRLFLPDPTEAAYTFVVVGDAQNSSSPVRRTAVMAALDAHDPVFILQTGDINVGTNLGDAADLFGEDWRINFFDPMPELQTRVPKYTVYGNHDDEVAGQRAAFQTVFPGLPDNGCYHFQHGPVAFFFLDIQNQIREFFQKGQDEWLRDAVSLYPDAVWRVVVFHVPPWSGGHRGERDWTIGQRERMLATFQEVGIDLAFCGHDHNYQRIKPLTVAGSPHPPVQFVTTGLAGSNYYDAEEKEYIARVVNRKDHYCRVDVTPDHLSIQVLTPDGEVLDTFALRRHDRTQELGVWTALNNLTHDPEDTGSVHHANATAYSLGINAPGASGGPLRDFRTGADLPVIATLSGSAGVEFHSDQGADSALGTDARTTFGGVTGMQGSLQGSGNGWYVDLTFTGLDPEKVYEFATSANRDGGTAFNTRVSRFTIQNAEDFTNASTPGVTLHGEDSVSFSTGNNTAAGYVARWTNIRSGDDGSFNVRVTHATTETNTSAFDVFLLREMSSAQDFASWLLDHGVESDPEAAFGELTENGVPFGVAYALAENLLPDDALLEIRLRNGKVIIDMPEPLAGTEPHVRLTVKTVEDFTRPLSEWSPVTRPAEDTEGKHPHRLWLEMDAPENRAFFLLEAVLLNGELPFPIQF